jgi:hypothetical protein
MNLMARRALFSAALLLAFAGGAIAQPNKNYDIKPMNFGLWCQETMSLPSERCAKRLPEDVAAFDVFRQKIEAYEIPDLQEKNRSARIASDILHGDAIDRSPTRSMQAQSQQGGLTPRLPSSVP